MRATQNNLAYATTQGPNACVECKHNVVLTPRPAYRLGCTHPRVARGGDVVPISHARCTSGPCKMRGQYWEEAT